MKGSRVYLRIEPETKEKWAIEASSKGLSLTGYIIESVEQRLGVVRTEPKEVKKVKEPVRTVKKKPQVKPEAFQSFSKESQTSWKHVKKYS